MADPISATLSSPEAKSDREWNAYQRLLQDQYEQGYKSAGGSGVAPRVSLSDKLAAENKYKSGEFKRRSEAAPKAYETAKGLDALNADVQNQVRSALRDRSQMASEFNRQNKDLNAQSRFDAQDIQQKLQQGLKEQDLNKYKNAADRFDKMQALYENGQLQYELMDLAQKGQLAQADIERLKQIILNDLNMELKDIGLMKDIELEKLKSAWEAKSSLIGSIMSGAGSIAGAFIKKG
jgi:hypothetical protein